MIKTHRFNDDYDWANNPKNHILISQAILDYWPNVSEIVYSKEHSKEDRSGVDCTVYFNDNTSTTIDYKIRRSYYDDILLEEWSNCHFNWQSKQVIKGNSIGWALDESKSCEWILYAKIPPNKQPEFYFYRFNLLLNAFKSNITTWKNSSKCFYPKAAFNHKYTTVSIAVPHDILDNAIAIEEQKEIEFLNSLNSGFNQSYIDIDNYIYSQEMIFV